MAKIGKTMYLCPRENAPMKLAMYILYKTLPWVTQGVSGLLD